MAQRKTAKHTETRREEPVAVPRMMTMAMGTMIKKLKDIINKMKMQQTKTRKTTKSNKTRMSFSDKQMPPSRSNVRRTRGYDMNIKRNSIRRRRERMLRDKKRRESRSKN